MDDWEKLHSEFLALAQEENVFGGFTAAATGDYADGFEFGCWRLDSVVTQARLLVERFLITATKAGILHGTPAGCYPLDVWFHHVFLTTGKTYGHSSDGRCVLRSIFTASAIYSGAVLRQSLEQEHIARIEREHADDPRNWPPLRRELEAIDAFKKLDELPAKRIPEPLVRKLIAEREGIRPEDIPISRIKFEVSGLVPLYKKIEVYFPDPPVSPQDLPAHPPDHGKELRDATEVAAPIQKSLSDQLDDAAKFSNISHEEQAHKMNVSRSVYFEVKAGRGGRKSRRKAEIYLAHIFNKMRNKSGLNQD